MPSNVRKQCALQNTKDGHNKFYFMFLYDNDDLEVHWGAINAYPQKKIYPKVGERGYWSKRDEKLYKRGYSDVSNAMANPGGYRAPFKAPGVAPSREPATVQFGTLDSPEAIKSYIEGLFGKG